jgi:hydroxymethylpyrimidine pyrophosphatase-like HAD family hydrolase
VSYPPKQRSELLWAAIDFDGTIATSTWTPDNPLALPGAPIEGVRWKLWALIGQGYKVVIHTSRPWSDYELIESYLNHHGLPHNKVICGKLLAAVYVDDRAVHSSREDWSGK